MIRVMAAADETSGECALCENIRMGCSIDDVRETLWRGVWEYMSMSPNKHPIGTLEARDFPWMLVSCSYSGCFDMLSMILHYFFREHAEDPSPSSANLKRLINLRTPCNFPLPDSWVHQYERLALSPLHLACWRMDLSMIRALLRLGADPNALALECCEQFKRNNEAGEKGDNIGRNESCMFSKETHPRSSTEPHNDLDYCISRNGTGREPSEETVANSAFYRGKDDNSVYSQETNVNTIFSEESQNKSNNSAMAQLEKEYLNLSNGLSPLDFVVLGVRSPPTYSLRMASENRVIHDVLEQYSWNRRRCNVNPDKECSDNAECTLCHTLCFPLEDKGELHLSGNSEEFDDVTEELLIKCLQLLISSGANPNQGRAKCLKFAYPLDLLIQPPIHIYYGSTMGRSSQLAGNLRRANLVAELPKITTACHVLLSHDARISPSFISLYRWKPRYLDCFTVETSSDLDLIKILVRLGIFSEELINNVIPACEDCESSSREADDHKDRYINAMRENIETFIAGVVNNLSPKELVSTVFQWVSVSTIHLFITVASNIIEKSEFEHCYLSDLVQDLIKIQLRSLTHSSMLVILKSTHARHSAIETLPLPNVLKRRLFHLNF